MNRPIELKRRSRMAFHFIADSCGATALPDHLRIHRDPHIRFAGAHQTLLRPNPKTQN